MINVPETVGRIIDDMRKYGNYPSWTQTGNTYTISSTNELSEDEWILVLDTQGATFPFGFAFPIVFTDDVPDLIENDPAVFGQFQAFNVTLTSFDIKSDTAPPAAGGWKSIEPFYLFGHRREISNRLLMKDKDKVYKFQKYPLFALRLPVNEEINADEVSTVSLNIAVLAFTDKNYTAKQRYDNVLTPILVPLYLDFIRKTNNNSEIMINGIPEHTKTDMLFYGVSSLEGNERYIFNDPIDGIEMTDFNLTLTDNCKNDGL